MADDDKPETEGGQGHPLPDSEESHDDRLPEHLVSEKGHGDDAHAASHDQIYAAPDGKLYDGESDPPVGSED